MTAIINHPLLRELRRTPLFALCEMEVHPGGPISSYVNLKRRPLAGTFGIFAVIAISTSTGAVKNCYAGVDFSISGRTMTFITNLTAYDALVVFYQYSPAWSSSSCSSSLSSSSSCSSSSCSSSCSSSSSSSGALGASGTPYHEQNAILPYEINYPLVNACPALVDGNLYVVHSCGPNDQDSRLSEVSSRTGVDFGGPNMISSITVRGITEDGGTPTGYSFFGGEFSIVKSDDNITYTEITSFNTPAFAHAAPGEIAWTFVFAPTTARYFAVTVGKNGAPLFIVTDLGGPGTQIQVSEIEWS